MGEGKLLAAGSALIVALGALPAQGPVYRERWGYLHVENRRAEVWRELAGRDAATRARVAQLLAEPDQGIPFAPPARALAHLRGVAADGAFVLRTAVSAFLLPEVADPVGQNETCRTLNVSVYLPFTVPSPGPLAFDVELRDRAGARVFAARITEDTSVADLRKGKPAARVPCQELADGTYEVTVRTVVDGVGPAATDPVLRWTCHVRRGYQAQCEAALARARDAAAGLPALPRSLLVGLAAQVQRAYAGEAFDVRSDALHDVDRLELALQNVAADRHVLLGMVGDLPVALPTSTGHDLSCVLRRAGAADGESATPRPLVVFASGCPAYDVQARRPTAPVARGPAWLASELPRFGVEAGWHVAFLESPGAGRNYGSELLDAVRALRELCAVGDRPVVLVCEREAAAVVGFRTAEVRAVAAGLVLVGAGGLTGPMLDALGDWPVRAGLLQGFPGSEALQRCLDYADLKAREGAGPRDFAALAAERPAWLFGVPAFADPIEAFVRRTVGG